MLNTKVIVSSAADNHFSLSAAERMAAQLLGEFIADRWEVQYVVDVDILCFAYVVVDMTTGGVFELDVLNTTLPDTGRFTSLAESVLLSNRIEHPRVARIVDHGYHQNVPYFVAGEIADCETVADYLGRRGRTVPPAETLRIVADVLEVMDAAHQEDIVHGWLEPRAVLLLDNGSVVMRGFGLSELRARAAAQYGLALAPDSVMFKSPEQLQGDPNHCFDDVWAAAALLFVLSSGQRLYPGETEQEMYRAAMLGERRRLDDVEPGAPRELVAVLERALAPERGQRFDSAKDLSLKLRQLADLPFIRPRRHLADELPFKEEARQRTPAPSGRPPSVRPPPPASLRPAGRFSGAYSQVTPSASQTNVSNLTGRPAESENAAERFKAATRKDKPERKA